jgi:hypothetical protein
MTDVKNRFAALEAEIAALKASISPAPPAPTKPKPIEEEGTTVTYPTAPSKFVMPTDVELRTLAAIVAAKYPKIANAEGLIFRGDAEQNEAEYFKQFKASFIALGALGRAEAPIWKRSVVVWMDSARDFLRNSGVHAEISFNPFYAAAIAQGDLPHSDTAEDGGCAALGLKEHGGRRATDAWRRVLSTGQLLAAVPFRPASRNYPAPPVQLRIG